MLVYTDGLSDVRNRKGGFFGTDGIVRFMREHAAGKRTGFSSALVARTESFRGSRAQEDDLSFILITRRKKG